VPSARAGSPELVAVLETPPHERRREKAAAKKAASRLGSALRRAGVSHRMRVHTHGGRCVSAHLDPEMAGQLAGLLARLRKLEPNT
jgi:hypothetical protein